MKRCVYWYKISIVVSIIVKLTNNDKGVFKRYNSF